MSSNSNEDTPGFPNDEPRNLKWLRLLRDLAKGDAFDDDPGDDDADDEFDEDRLKDDANSAGENLVDEALDETMRKLSAHGRQLRRSQLWIAISGADIALLSQPESAQGIAPPQLAFNTGVAERPAVSRFLLGLPTANDALYSLRPMGELPADELLQLVITEQPAPTRNKLSCPVQIQFAPDDDRRVSPSDLWADGRREENYVIALRANREREGDAPSPAAASNTPAADFAVDPEAAPGRLVVTAAVKPDDGTWLAVVVLLTRPDDWRDHSEVLILHRAAKDKHVFLGTCDVPSEMTPHDRRLIVIVRELEWSDVPRLKPVQLTCWLAERPAAYLPLERVNGHYTFPVYGVDRKFIHTLIRFGLALRHAPPVDEKTT